MLSLLQNSNLTQVADSIAQLTESSGDLDANDVGIIAGFVEEIAVEATQNEEVRKAQPNNCTYLNNSETTIVTSESLLWDKDYALPLYTLLSSCSIPGKKGLFGYT